MGSLTPKQRAARNIRWIEDHCRIPEGRDVGKPVHLRAWQKKDLRKIYGNPAVTRTHIQCMGRKNGKTAMSAFIVLLHLVGPENVKNSQLVSTAQSRDQAALLHALAAKIVRMSPTLEPFVIVRDSKKQLFAPELGTLYTALSADASTNFGSSPILHIADEIGQVKGPTSDLFDAVETGMGAHESPLTILISTQAPTDADLLSILIDNALDGHDPRTTISFYTAPEDDDPWLISTIRKANPAYGDFLNETEIKNTRDKAKAMVSREPAYRNLVLNQRVDASEVFVSRTVWDMNSAPALPIDQWGDTPVYGGLDLSSTTDLTALVLMAKKSDKWHVQPTFWLPRSSIVDRSKEDRVPYDVWHNQGYMETTPGTVIDYEFVAHYLRQVFNRCNVAAIAFDRWNWKHMRPWLVQAGFRDHELEKFIPFGQGYVSMSPALREFEAVLLSKQMCHGNHPVLKMCAVNAVVQSDPAGNRKLAKDKSSGRIDGMVALAMAVGVTDNGPDQYVTGRLLTV